MTGLLLPSREVLLWADGDLASLVTIAADAEKAGYDSVWVGDSLLARPRGEPLALLAAIAVATNGVKLGTAVMLPLLRHPVSLAHQLATVDRIARGRVIAGVGPGAELPGTHTELKAVGVPSERRVSAMLTAIERCRRLWRNEEAGIELQPRPFTAGGPPIWVGGASDAALRRAVVHGDGWHPIRFRIDWLKDKGLPRLREIAEAEQKPTPALCPRVRLRLTSSPVAEDRRAVGEGALDQVRADLEALLALGARYVLLDTYADDPEATRRPETGWEMLTTLAERVLDLPRKSLR